MYQYILLRRIYFKMRYIKANLIALKNTSFKKKQNVRRNPLNENVFDDYDNTVPSFH